MVLYHLSCTSGVSLQELNSTADFHQRECYFVCFICSSFSVTSQTYGTLFLLLYLSSSVEGTWTVLLSVKSHLFQVSISSSCHQQPEGAEIKSVSVIYSSYVL